MLPSAHRLRRSADFSRVVREGRRTASPTLVLHTLDLGGAEPTRVGFVVSKAVGGAVVRNRVRRRLRHLALALLTTPGRAFVIRANPAAARATSALLRSDLDRCVRKAMS
ncbi:MAG: ribonuclease P protein component [Nocardioidaceae bacterium]